MVDAIIIPILWARRLRDRDVKSLAQGTQLVSGGDCMRTLGCLTPRGLFLPSNIDVLKHFRKMLWMM